LVPVRFVVTAGYPLKHVPKTVTLTLLPTCAVPKRLRAFGLHFVAGAALVGIIVVTVGGAVVVVVGIV